MSGKPSKWEQLQNLKDIFESGFITPEEYSFRKQQLIDKLTGTTGSSENLSLSTKSRSRKRSDMSSRSSANLPAIVPHPPPNFAKVPQERAIRYIFNVEKTEWNKADCKVKIDEVPFARGGLRLVYHLLDLEEKQNMVAKISMDPRDNDNRRIYFQDVEMQSYAKEYAAKFNNYNPPKQVDFVAAFILELVERPGKPLCGVEKYIEGPYRKHNNNYGYVSQEERNTPQAFSHFTYEASQHTLLICDIQGVGDLYTDPQVHTMDQRRLGKGDLGKRGIDKFLETHRCNPICRYLKLPALNDGDFADEGTLPSSTLMAYTQIRSENIYLSPSSPSLEPSQLPLLARRPSIPTTSKQRANLCDCCTIL